MRYSRTMMRDAAGKIPSPLKIRDAEQLQFLRFLSFARNENQ